ncbi:membrane protein insertion efficiency factor YidD [Uliginosibacterium sp. 31-16]|uniref:membrane protein insertion efficiency factor YidD n=1 Tax=Uliginosibacterium sp. 31-16 TaxID=3068315 RepID=UPI00273F8974|nr:membrane protein insertion efficiency factor YidD [Uliginosibacterium sp. 31-16]MDP5238904.1 membrane protein insertion efficiency factor YidD [Uliginosibacterium sp. 31-16]
MKTLFVWLLQGYRYAISPWLGNRCRYYPSCSAYAIEALHKHGLLKGLRLAVWRVLRCHPWCDGGHDPVP